MARSLVGDLKNWDQRLAALAERHDVPGAVLGIMHDDDIVEAAHGVLNLETGVDTTTDSLFQIGSITKVWTATLAMRLVDEGALSLDAPIIDVLPELVLATPELTKRVTLRHLLSHTSGIDGDVFIVTLPEEVLRFRAAMGHVGGTGDPVRPAPVWGLPRSCGPAGGIYSTVRDVLAFARLHCAGGRTTDGTQLLSPESLTAMAKRQVTPPDPCPYGDAWGLGWILDEWDGHRVLAHDGATIGQYAFLRVLPDSGLAVALVTNGGRARDLYHELFREIFRELSDIDMPPPLQPPVRSLKIDPQKYVGVYERTGARLEVFQRDGQLILRAVATGELSESLGEQPQEDTLTPLAEDRFLTRKPGSVTWSPVRFYALPDGSQYVHMSVRATPKVA